MQSPTDESEAKMKLNNVAQVVAAYEKNGLSPSEIAESFGYAEAVIIECLRQESVVYRRRLRQDEETGMSEEQNKEMLDIILGIARDQRDLAPGVSLKAAIYARDEGKGRHKLRALGSGGININIINARLEGMKNARARVFGELMEDNNIEVPTSVRAEEPR